MFLAAISGLEAGSPHGAAVYLSLRASDFYHIE